MALTNKVNNPQKIAVIKIPLASFKCISSYPKDKKFLCEISTKNLKVVNDAGTLDEIINVGRLDYALGKYRTFTKGKDLIKELRS